MRETYKIMRKGLEKRLRDEIGRIRGENLSLSFSYIVDSIFHTQRKHNLVSAQNVAVINRQVNASHNMALSRCLIWSHVDHYQDIDMYALGYTQTETIPKGRKF